MCGERGREREGGVLGRERERERERQRERESKLYYPRIKVEHECLSGNLPLRVG